MSAIHTAIHAIQKDMEPLAKNGIGPQTQGGYKFLAVDDVLAAIKPKLDEHGVFVFPTLVESDFHVIEALRKDNERVPKANTFARLTYDFTFVAVEDGSSIVTRVIGEGSDTQDKAVRKATTSAWKIALIQTFALITGEQDPDASDGGHANNVAEATPESKGTRAVNSAKQRTGAAPAKPASSAAVTEAQAAVKAAWAKVHGDEPNFDEKGYMALGNKLFEKQRGWGTDVQKLTQLADSIIKGEVA